MSTICTLVTLVLPSLRGKVWCHFGERGSGPTPTALCSITEITATIILTTTGEEQDHTVYIHGVYNTMY